ncbi:hypothetical protein B0H13DRAFT_1906698 [Mycena leptocephala]|nr:hypothetical protein B0H13DRAFT_1906698 [Mycena leptocephala]
MDKPSWGQYTRSSERVGWQTFIPSSGIIRYIYPKRWDFPIYIYPKRQFLAFAASPTRADHGSGSDDSSSGSGDDGDSIGELSYPQVTLDATPPVVVVAWKDVFSDPIFLTVFPRAHDFPEDYFSRAEVVLEDCRPGLEDAGFPVTDVVERFLESIGDAVGEWVFHSWSTPIPIYNRNKFIYIKPHRAPVPFPDHIFELLRCNTTDLTEIILSGSAGSTSRASNLKAVKVFGCPVEWYNKHPSV